MSAQGIAARQAAQTALASILQKHKPLDSAVSFFSDLSQRDGGFARTIVSETLRRFGQLDALLRAFLKDIPPRHRSGPAYEILMAGACELLFLEVAPHAAVDAANRLAQADPRARHFKALINAVLHRIARDGASVIAAQDAERLNTPDWLWLRWVDAYGEAAARAVARAHGKVAPTDLVIKGQDATIPAGERLLDDVVRVLPGSRVPELPGFNGDWWVQDIAATLPVRLLGDVAGQDVIDLCAAPGGKTLQLAARGARVTSVEREESRMERLRENLVRMKLEANLVTEDLRDFFPPFPASYVLLDAPCSATGTIRRHPDLPWIKSATDINTCADAAQELIAAAAEITAPGGLLVYAVCSLEGEECREQIDAFLAARPDFQREPIAPEELFGHAEWIDRGDLRTMPFHLSERGGMDGFYAARLRRSR